MVNKENRYCIIGAGFCGLGVAKAFRDYGIAFDCLERNADVGGNWLNGVYDSTHIISSRDSTQYADFPMPRDYPDFPNASQVLAYLRSYAERFALRENIELNTEVEEAAPLDADGMSGWRVRLKSGEERRYAGVIVSNGHHWDKRVPSYPGEFTGKTLHSKDYKNTRDFEGRRILVVGAGNSGCDIAVEAALNGLESFISMRRGYYFLPKTIFGVPTAELDHPWIPFFAQKAIVKAAIGWSMGSNTRHGLEKPDHELFEHHPIVNSQLLYFIRHGRVKPKRDIERFEGKTVHFKDGTSIEADTIVWATGFHVSFPFLKKELFRWQNGIPKRIGGMLPEKLANLYVFGLSQPRGGAGPLITAGASLLAEMVLAQERLDHPIALDFERISPPSARMLIGVTQALREMRFARAYLRWILRKGRRASPPGSSGTTPPEPRNPKFPIDERVPRLWYSNSALATHLANSLNLLFPDGERFFIRAIRGFQGEIVDPELKKRVQGFMAQEVQHGREHERFFELLRAQGFELEGFLKWYRRIAYDWIEKAFPPRMHLAVTAAVEHYTAAFAEKTLRDDLFEDRAHPVVADLFRWHAMEELEHKSVAYDVFQSVAPGYGLRVAGMCLATATLGGFWAAGALELLRQDPETRWGQVARDAWAAYREDRLMLAEMGRAFFQYLVPGFHPAFTGNSGLARDAFRQLERRYGWDSPAAAS